MSMQYPISDMLVRIKNAQMANFKVVKMPSSKIKLSIAKVLKEQGYINSFKEVVTGVKKSLDIELKYFNGKPVIDYIKICSRPGLRVYKKYNELPVVKGGLGVAIVSTSKGVMTSQQAQQQSVGGEVICLVS